MVDCSGTVLPAEWEYRRLGRHGLGLAVNALEAQVLRECVSDGIPVRTKRGDAHYPIRVSAVRSLDRRVLYHWTRVALPSADRVWHFRYSAEPSWRRMGDDARDLMNSRGGQECSRPITDPWILQIGRNGQGWKPAEHEIQELLGQEEHED